MTNNDRIGLFGGSFNPIHIGHCILINNFVEELNLDFCLLVPANISPFKANEKTIIDKSHIINMINLELPSLNKVIYEDFEIKNSKISYTIDTINYVIKNYKPQNLYLHIGLDQINSFYKWKNWEDIVKKSILSISKRKINEPLNFEIIENIKNIGYKPIFLNSPLIEISSTEIRNRIILNKSIKYYVTDKVEKYIINNKLYK